MNSSTIELLRELRPKDADQADELFPGERRKELFAAITNESRRANTGGTRSARRRLHLTARRVLSRPKALSALGATAAAAIAAVVLSATSAVNPLPAQAVAFRTRAGGEIVATVTDPFAAQTRLDAAFAEQGLKITVKLLPVSPSIVGTVLSVDESNPVTAQIKPLQGGHCLQGGGGCPIGIEIPGDFRGEAAVYLGRPARPGERYESTASAFAPGEPLHCSGLLGAKVATALPVLLSKGLRVVEWGEDIEEASGESHSVTHPKPPIENYIWGADLTEPGKLTITTARAPWPDNPGAGSGFNAGCQAV